MRAPLTARRRAPETSFRFAQQSLSLTSVGESRGQNEAGSSCVQRVGSCDLTTSQASVLLWLPIENGWAASCQSRQAAVSCVKKRCRGGGCRTVWGTGPKRVAVAACDQLAAIWCRVVRLCVSCSLTSQLSLSLCSLYLCLLAST
ncbi:hypothetical protein BaRGS_00026079 [Batillaria attramentaria]|uniref:Uncharacterized protein n=1 Tax=Batillaria attramentaria TaxID=370345 RepID=A0ABD0K765_9CAEN